MGIAGTEGELSVLEVHYLVARDDGIERFQERHDLGLFTPEQHLDAFRAARLEVFHDPDGLTGRGLYVGVRPLPPAA